MMGKPNTCAFCIWLSTGFADDVRGSGWCYSNGDYRDNDDTCPFWQASLRDEPVSEPVLVTKDVITYPLSAFAEDEDS